MVTAYAVPSVVSLMRNVQPREPCVMLAATASPHLMSVKSCGWNWRCVSLQKRAHQLRCPAAS